MIAEAYGRRWGEESVSCTDRWTCLHMPASWRGWQENAAGRLHNSSQNQEVIEIIDEEVSVF